MLSFTKPKLRNVNVQRTVYQGEPVFVIQDGLRLTEAMIVLPQVLGPLALLCDGQHTLPEIQSALELRYGLRLDETLLEGLLEQFDQALLLEGETFNQTKAKIIDEYRAEPFRKPALAGSSYPADPKALRQLLQGYQDKAGEVTPSPVDSRAVISPHIDYQRGGLIYAQVWASAADAIREAELVIILGTDHNGGLGTLTLSPQNYASPLGTMPTDKALVERLAQALGPEHVFAEELHHRGEWSIELDLVWLQYLRQEKPCPVLPVLCGSFHHFMLGRANIGRETRFPAFVEVLQEEMSKRRTVIVASGDLAHMGPAFDGPPLDSAAYDQMKVDDGLLMQTLCQGSAEGFFNFMKAGQYERNVCGLSPFYFTLKLLDQTQGHLIAYDRCPADTDKTSFVSVCGIVLE